MTNASDVPSADNDGLSDWETQRAAQERLHAELQPLNKTALFDALAAAGITLVVVSFDGYGDSGQIQNAEVKAGDTVVAMPEGTIDIAEAVWDQPEPNSATVSIADAIECLVYDFLSDTHCGWENNDGAYGDFTFDVAERTITPDYNERYTASDFSQQVFSGSGYGTLLSSRTLFGKEVGRRRGRLSAAASVVR